MLKALYTIFAVGVVSLYSAAAMLGWEISGGSRHRLPLVPLLALWLTRRKMMLIDSTIFALAIPMESLLPLVVTTIVFVVLGLIVFALAFLVIAKATPFSVRKEIEEDQNVALAIVIASVILGSALIIAAAVHG